MHDLLPIPTKKTVYGTGIAAGSSAKFGALSPVCRGYGRHRSDPGLPGPPMPAALAPDLGVASRVPVIDGARDRLLDLFPGLEESALDRQGPERLPPGLYEVAVGGVLGVIA